MRNPPERYLQILQECFARAPQWLGAGKDCEADYARAPTAPLTTNQDGKHTAFQRWFHFKEAFSPDFVSAAIDSLGYRPRHVIDPFGGSGTSAITAQLLSIDATTIEVNPFLADVIQAKVSTLSADALRSAAADFQAMLPGTRSNISRLGHWPPTFVEGEGKNRWIFPLNVARRLSQYLTCIDAIEDDVVQRFFRVVLGAVLVDCSNVYVNGKGRRYRSGWQENEPTPRLLDEMFASQFNTSFEDVLRFEQRPRSRVSVINGDSRAALPQINEPADLIVFSPPYPNSFDYTDIYNVELWVLGYLRSATENQKLRKETLRSHVQIRRPYELPQRPSHKLSQTLKALHSHQETLWDGNIPAMVGAYFRDLEAVLEQCKRLLAPSGKVIMVVGDSRYASVRIEVAAILAELASEIGFGHVLTREVRQMRLSAQQGGHFQLAESVVELSL
ncbi:SAM-dependent methyltransferase [Burkholderia multivorans]|uniref:SAM-dependent methyltransferase n=2 Tax=Burkholderia multivorans TaxID=87883 RepID=A0A2S9MCU4_9BURK|nr:SAM-dependent methyltransferase [Burkholderia multivorans]MBU9514765.1 SAM-dependent methyltransferase [Burkholderia multivorans]MBU9525185.1 SAM-dependent methyltransferase [Burkholderia multivorans]MBU9538665.1 SAM-dependent methyltransferase [Burkholderia multivorans]MBU9636591.1 SAM-dependent methyltransferase [Burkholderia multivorans]PRF11467.1 SAM-dependent methyltransferase [Burkholderia multivorans]